MTDRKPIEDLQTFIESSAFKLMPFATQEEMKLRLQQLLEAETKECKESVVNDIKSAVTPILQSSNLQIVLLVTCDNKGVVEVREIKEEPPTNTVSIQSQPEEEPFVLTPEVDTNNAIDQSLSTRDTSKYSFNGSAPMSKRRLAWNIVKAYIERYPDVDYNHLKEVFVPEIVSPKLGVVRSLVDMPSTMPESEYPRRYMMKDDELIYLKDSDIITVCSQWNVQRIAKMIELAIDEGWTIERIEENSLPIQNNVEEIDTITTTKSKSIGFTVKFHDGKICKEKNAKETFIKALKKIGLQRIARGNHGVIHHGVKLVSEALLDIDGKVRYQEKVDGYYIYTCLSNQAKKDDIERLSKYYRLGIRVYWDE